MVGTLWLEEDISVTLAGESTRDPGVSIVKVPHDDADTFLDVCAGLDGVVVVLNLLLLRCLVRWEIGADVELSDNDLDTFADKGSLRLKLLVVAWGGAYVRSASMSPFVQGHLILTNDEMALQSNTVNLNTSSLQLLDQIQCCRSLVIWRFDIIVVVVQLHIQSVLLDDLLSRSECLKVR
jgi:hypothetical protein